MRFKGLSYIGLGVSDMEKSLKFYGDLLGFKEKMFDYKGTLPGMDQIIGKSGVKARIVMLRNENLGPMGLGMLELVQILPPDKPDPCGNYPGRADALWGDIGITEVACAAHNLMGTWNKMMEKGCKPVLIPAFSRFGYTSDLDGALMEFVDSYMIPDAAPRVEGVNHVGFGVSDAERSVKFYKDLGFTVFWFDYTGEVSVMASMFPEPVKLRIAGYRNPYGGAVEAIQLISHKPKVVRGRWGHLGCMEFAVEVSNIERAYDELQKKGIKFRCPPQTIKLPEGEWKYAYLVEPDGHYVSIVECRF